MRKYAVLGLVAAVVFSISYAVSAVAVPYGGRAANRGYFTNAATVQQCVPNTSDCTSGDQVFRQWSDFGGQPGCTGDGTYAIPFSAVPDDDFVSQTVVKQRFIDFVICKLNSNVGNTALRTQDRIGAAFLIQNMRDVAGVNACTGESSPGVQKINNFCRPTAAEITDWTGRIMNPDVAMWSFFMWQNDMPASWDVNSRFMGRVKAGKSSPADVTFYPENIASSEIIVFHHAGGDFIIRRQCANPIGQAPGLPSGYQLQPTVNVQTTSGERVVQQGDQVTFRYTVANTGQSTSATTNCSITGTQPSGTSGPPGTNCPRTFAVTGSGSPAEVTNAPEVITISSQSAGSQICRRLTVDPGGSGIGAVSSTNECVIVAKKPYVHFMGSDVWAGGGFAGTDGTCTTQNANIVTSSSQSSSAGSLVEYGAFALGSVTKFGSGNSPLYNPDDNSYLGRRLSFANTPTVGNFGAPQHCMNDYSSTLDALPVVAAPALNGPDNGAWHVASLSGFGGTLQSGKEKIYYVDGDVVVTSDIKYPDTFSNLDAIPSLVIIAKGNIYVHPGVGRMDGIFITRGTFYTCYPYPSQPPSPPTNSTCNTQLTVNGAVEANSVDLYRTFGGAGTTIAERQRPAEIFNYSPELMLKNALDAIVGNPVTTSGTRELPPRF
jgi:hypothetical protein